MPKGVHNNHPKMEKHGRWKGGERILNGYMMIRLAGHPSSNATGYVKRAVLVMEAKLGRHMAPGEEVHHRDEVKTNDHPDNLEVLSKSEHAALHAAIRGPLARRFETRMCAVCGASVTRKPSKFQKPAERTACGAACRKKLNAGNRDSLGRFAGRRLDLKEATD